MKKTTTIHLAGMVYHIEEDGYRILQQYIDDIHRVFSKEEGVNEMIEDIEVRIAELFQERLNAYKEVVTFADVQEVISIVGSPHQFEDTGEQDSRQEQTDAYSNKNESKRLYRDTDEGMVAGVNAGLGHYFNIDPVIIRVLWIVLVLVGGSGILLYIIAWIAIPEAKTTSEKLRMRGQSANLDNIKEFTDKVKQEAKSGVKRASKSIKKTVNKGEGIIYNILRFFARLLGLGMVIGGIIGLVFVTIGFIGNFSYIYLDGEVFSEGLKTMVDLVFTYPGWAFWLILIVLSVPLIFLCFFGLMLLSKRMRKLKVIILILLVIWIAAIVGISVIGINTGVGFNESYKTQNKTVLNQDYNALALHLFEDSIEISDYIDNDFEQFISITKNSVNMGYTRIKIAPTKDSLFSYVIEKQSKGNTLRNAKDNAEQIDFGVEQSDSLLNVPIRYQFPIASKFRNQKVFLRINVPIGKQIVLNGNLDDYPIEIKSASKISDDVLEQSSVWKATNKGLVFVKPNDSSISH